MSERYTPPQLPPVETWDEMKRRSRKKKQHVDTRWLSRRWRRRKLRTPAKDEKWKRYEGTELEPALRSGAIALLDAEWLVDFAYCRQIFRTGPLPHRQALPSNAFLSLDQVKNMTGLDCRGGINIVVLSHMWLHPTHPDPKGSTLQTLAYECLNMLQRSQFQPESKIGIFWDWASLHQHPDPANGVYRNATETQLFQQGLAELPKFFAHKYTRCFKITKFPEGYPNGYNLPYGANLAEYDERGWPFVENLLASITKGKKQAIDLCTNHSNKERRGPLSPERVQEKLSVLKFTNNEEDRPRVLRLYRDEFTHRFGRLEFMDFSGMQWSNTDIERVSDVIGSGYTPLLTDLCLSGNKFDVDGCVALARALSNRRRPKMLVSVSLAKTSIGDEGVEALAEALVRIPELDLNNTGLGVRGCRALVKASDQYKNQVNGIVGNKKAPNLSDIDLSGNAIGDDGVEALAETLLRLGSVNLSSTNLGIRGCEALAKAFVTYREKSNLGWLQLDCNERIGDTGVKLLCHIIVYHTETTSLDRCNIGDAGIQALAEAAAECNKATTLISLDLQGNQRMTVDGCASHLVRLVQNCPQMTTTRSIVLYNLTLVKPLDTNSLRSRLQSAAVVPEQMKISFSDLFLP